MPKYYCDYCDTYLTHDSASVRKSHIEGVRHQAAVRAYYAQLDSEYHETDRESVRYAQMKNDAMQFMMMVAPPMMPLGAFPPMMPPTGFAPNNMPFQGPPPSYGAPPRNDYRGPNDGWNDNRGGPRQDNRGPRNDYDRYSGPPRDDRKSYGDYDQRKEERSDYRGSSSRQDYPPSDNQDQGRAAYGASSSSGPSYGQGAAPSKPW